MVSIFYFSDGRESDSIQGLYETLKKIDENTFKYHCNAQKNDFYSWISQGLGDEDTAKAIRRIRTKKGMIAKLKKLF